MSNLRADNIANKAGTGPIALLKQWAAKATVNFDGTGTIAIRASNNVSGLVDSGVGSYSVNFINSFSAVNYSAGGACQMSSVVAGVVAMDFNRAASSVGTALIRSYYANETTSGVIDNPSMNLQAFGELA